MGSSRVQRCSRGSRGVRVLGVLGLVTAGLVAGPVRSGAASPPVVGVGDVAVVEGDAGLRTVKVPVSLSDPQAGPVTVSYTTTAVSATPGTDYTAKVSGSVMFKAGQVVRAVPVKVAGDTVSEGTETLTVTLTAVTGGVVLGRTVGTVSILDDDPTSGLEVGVGDVSVVEGDAGGPRKVGVPVTLSQTHTADVTVPYTVSAGSATAGVDYTAKVSGTVKVGAGKLAGKVNVTVLADLGAEPDETVTVSLGSPSAGTVSRASGTLSILDDEGLAPSNVFAWGYNGYGPFGNGTTTSTNSPVPGPAGTDWTQVATGGVHSCGIRTDGTLWCWGYNGSGQLGDGSYTDSDVPVQVGTATDWTGVAAGSFHSCGIRADGSLWCWGRNVDGQLGNGTYAGSLVPVQVGTGTDWTRIAGGDRHTCGIRSTGTLWCWGFNAYGQLGNGTNTDSSVPVQVGTGTDWTGVAGGTYHSCGIRGTGTLWCWGLNFQGQLGNGTNTNSNVPVQEAGAATDWTHVVTGGRHSCGIRSTGTLWCWGLNFQGQLGNGTNTDSNVPVQVGTGTDWARIAAGDQHSCGLRGTGTVWCWGRNVSGQLGNGSNADSNVPVQEATATTDWTDLAVMGGGYQHHTLALK